MNAALFILAASCIVMAGLLWHVAVRHNALIEYQREMTRQYLNLEDENIDLKGKNLRKHVAMNRLARKCKRRGKTIETLERRIGIMNAQHEADGDLNGAFAKQILELKELTGKQCATISGLEKQIEEADKKLIEMSKQYEAKIAELKRRDNCPFKRTAKNRISYCTKEDK